MVIERLGGVRAGGLDKEGVGEILGLRHDRDIMKYSDIRPVLETCRFGLG